jgi:hypothetical protein
MPLVLPGNRHVAGGNEKSAAVLTRLIQKP